MTVSFTGLNNLKITKVKPKGVRGIVRTPEQDYSVDVKQTNIEISFNLTNDCDGNDLNEIFSVYSKAGRNYAFNPQKPNEIKITLINKEVENHPEVPIHKSLRVNDQDMDIQTRNDLGIYTYFAKITQRLKNTTDSENQKKCIDMVNQTIQEQAVDYIENVLPTQFKG